MSRKKEKKQFSEVKIFKLPVGKLISRRSTIATDQISQEGIAEVEKIVSSEKEGLSVFFAHLGLFDAFGTAAAMEKAVDYKAVFPAAASWYYFPLLTQIFKRLESQLPHEFIPVFRREELGGSNLNIKFLDFSGLDEAGKKQANREYVAHTAQAQKDGSVVMLSPYGGRAPKLEYLRSGPVTLMQQGSPIVFSLTVWNWHTMKYEVFFSKPMRFPQNIGKQEAHEIIYAEFLRMAQLSNVSEQQMLESKTSSFLTKNIWKFMAVVLSLYLLWSVRNKGSKKTT